MSSFKRYYPIASYCAGLILLLQGCKTVPSANFTTDANSKGTIPTLVAKNCSALLKEAIPWQQPELIARFRQNGIPIPDQPKEAKSQVIQVSFDPLNKEKVLQDIEAS